MNIVKFHYLAQAPDEINNETMIAKELYGFLINRLLIIKIKFIAQIPVIGTPSEWIVSSRNNYLRGSIQATA